MISRFITSNRDSLYALANIGTSRLIITAFSFLSSILIARNLGAEQLGIYAIIIGVFAYISIIGDFGLRSVITVEASRLGGAETVFKNYIRLRLLISLSVYVITMVGCCFFYSEYIKPTALIMMGVFFFSLQVDWLLLVYRYYHSAAWVAAVRWVAYLLMVALTLQFTELTLFIMSQIFLYSWIISAFISWCIVFRKGALPQSNDKTSSVGSKKLLILGGPVLGATLVSQAIQNADLLWIGKAFGSKEAGYYYLASSITVAALIFANAIGQIATTQYAGLRGDLKKIRDKLKADIRISIGIGCVAGLALYLSRPLIIIFFGESFVYVGELIIYFIPYVIIYHLWSLYFSILIALGLERNLLYAKIGIVFILPFILLAASSAGDIKAIALSKTIVLSLGVFLMYLKTPKYLKGIFSCFLKPVFIVVFFTALFVFLSDHTFLWQKNNLVP